MIEKKIFESLETPKRKGVLKAKSLKKNSRFYICKSSDGFINFLIKTTGKTDSIPYNLKHINISHNELYEIEENNKSSSIICTHIKCKTTSSNISNIFFEQVHFLSNQIKESDSDNQVGRKLDNIIEIFKSFNKKATRTIRGLWAELFIIYKSSNPDKMLKAWHQNVTDRYDFSFDSINLEIKSRGKLKPVEAQFSMNQIEPPKGSTKVIVTSVYVDSSSSGLSVIDLRNEINKKLRSNTLKEKLDLNFYKILGDNLQNEQINTTYDVNIAAKNTSFFDLKNIPKIDIDNIPDEIISLSFKVDLTNIPELSNSYLKKFPFMLNIKNILSS